MNFKIVYEDKNILVAEKPQGMISQSESSKDADLCSEVLTYVKAVNKAGVVNIINRLDRPVGGLVLFGKTSEATKNIAKDLLSKQIKKDYLAVVEGFPNREVEVLEDHISKCGDENISKIAFSNEKNAKLAKLSFKLLEKSVEKNLSLLNVRLQTGRHHQIRVQLSNYGTPIWGDTKYNSSLSDFKGWIDIALWAYKLSFNHPISRKLYTFYSFPPSTYPWTEFKAIEHLKKTDV